MDELARALEDEKTRGALIDFLNFLVTASRSELAEMDRLLGEATGEGVQP